MGHVGGVFLPNGGNFFCTSPLGKNYEERPRFRCILLTAKGALLHSTMTGAGKGSARTKTNCLTDSANSNPQVSLREQDVFRSYEYPTHHPKINDTSEQISLLFSSPLHCLPTTLLFSYVLFSSVFLFHSYTFVYYLRDAYALLCLMCCALGGMLD